MSLDSLLAPMLGSRCYRYHAANESGTITAQFGGDCESGATRRTAPGPKIGSSASAPACFPCRSSTGTGIEELANGQAGASPPILCLFPVVGRP